jgi:hypothetical protein
VSCRAVIGFWVLAWKQPSLRPRDEIPVAQKFKQRRGKHHIAILATLCVGEIYVAMALVLPAAKPLSVIMATHKFLPVLSRDNPLFAFGMPLRTRRAFSGRSTRK